MDNPTPSFGKLYFADFNIKGATQMVIGSLLFQGITYFGFEKQFYPPLVASLAALTMIGIIWLIYRYNLITTTFREGITVRARVTDTETIVTSTEKGGRRRSYYAKIAYTVGGESYEPRLRLPGEPIFYGIEEGGDVDIILREEKPKTFFIKSIYLN